MAGLNPCLHSLVHAAEALACDFSKDPACVLPPLVTAALAEQAATAVDASAIELEELLATLGWDPEVQMFATPPDPQTLASNLKSLMLTDLQLVGEGSYSLVYKARNRLDGTTVMLKKLRIEGGGEGLSATAIREMSLLRELTGSPYIVRYGAWRFG
jgi:hypothetical protein